MNAVRKWKEVPHHPNVYRYETRRGTRYGIRRGFKNSVGKRDEYTRSGFTNWHDAEGELKRFEASLVTGGINPLTHRGVTLNAYFAALVKNREELGVWRPATVIQKKTYYRKHLQERFGNRPMSKISRSEYQQFIDEKIKSGLAQTTMRTLNSVMQIIMNDAEHNDIIRKNMLRGILINGAKPPKDVSITDEDYAKFMATAQKLLNKYQLTMLYLLTLGERREELAGLQFRSFKRGTTEGKLYYEITYYVGRTPQQPLGGPLKTPSSYRTNYVTGPIIDYIDYSLQYAKNILTRTHREIGPETFIYLNEKTGMPVHPSNINRNLFQRVKEATGIELRPHMLRHYFATQALQDGLPQMSVMHWLGHKNIDMTNDYTRPTREGSLKVINGMGPILFKNGTAGPDGTK
ncbi:MAG: site-specific integrase [Lacticaseibacillus paracasei]|nr:site-specific integrase [Lacticaseibacillus paracasei]